MAKYISVPQGRSCRFDGNQHLPEIIGLYTDSFSECNVLIIYKKEADNINISMTHVDRYTNKEQILSELVWMGHECSVLVLRKNNADAKEIYADIIFSLLPAHNCRYCEDNSFAVSFGKDCIPAFYSRDDLPSLDVHPFEWRLHSCYMLNITSVLCYRHAMEELPGVTRVLFNGVNWVDLTPEDTRLLPFTQKMLDFARSQMLSNCSRTIAVQIFQEFFRNQNIMPAANVPLVTAVHSLLLITQNNYQKIFNDELDIALDKLQNDVGFSDVYQCLGIFRELAIATRNNFELLKDHPVLMQLPQKIGRPLLGIYKICCRMKQHTSVAKAVVPAAVGFWHFRCDSKFHAVGSQLCVTPFVGIERKRKEDAIEDLRQHESEEHNGRHTPSGRVTPAP